LGVRFGRVAMDSDVLNWFFDANVRPSMINFENLPLGRRERSVLRELLRTNGYWRIEASQDKQSNCSG
jgi:hypothetical protein